MPSGPMPVVPRPPLVITTEGAPKQLTWKLFGGGIVPLFATTTAGGPKFTVDACDTLMPAKLLFVICVDAVCRRSVEFVSTRTPAPVVLLIVTPCRIPVLPVETFTPLAWFCVTWLMLLAAQVGNAGSNVHWSSTVEPSNAPTPSFAFCDTVVPSRRSFEP